MKKMKVAFLLIPFLLPILAYSQEIVKEKETKAANQAKEAIYRKRPNASMPAFNIKGAYHMDRQVITRGTHDTVYHTPQLKLYTNNYFIYVHPHETDSLADYGIGTYLVNGSKIMEYPFYTSAGGAQLDSFELMVNKKANGYSQIINYPDQQTGNFVLTEDYTKVGKPLITPLDGAWKQIMVTHVGADGSKKVNTNPVQFKVFESGYFIWVNTVSGAGTQKAISNYGYGTFTMKGKNTVQEINQSSTYISSLVGKPVNLQISFIGTNSYQQTEVFPSGEKVIEKYERLH